MLRLAIVDDNPNDSAALRVLVADYLTRNNHAHVIQEFNAPLDFIRSTENHDIVFMDIRMDKLDGLEVARIMRKINTDSVLVFVTAMAQLAIKGYEVDALYYIVKPVNYFAFSQRMMRAISRIGNREAAYLAINQKGGVRKLDIRGIYYVESLNHNLTFHTREGDYTVFGSLKDVEQRLSAHHFVRCNKGYLVSLRHVDRIEDGCAVVQGKPLLISRNRRNSFLEALANYFGDSMV